jgi:hypothetical protein
VTLDSAQVSHDSTVNAPYKVKQCKDHGLVC